MDDKIIKILEDVRGALQADGGDLELVKIEGKTVYVRLRGACGHCPHAMATIKGYVEQMLKDNLDPEITVERVD